MTDDPPEPLAERSLLSRARAGDAAAFCLLIGPLESRLLRQATALTRDVSAAEDIVSDTRVRAWKSLSRYNSRCRLSTWLYAILLHCHQEAARRARSRPMSVAHLTTAQAMEVHQRPENESSPALSPAAAAVHNEISLELFRCVEMLPEKHREVVQLRFFEDASLSDIAALLGCSVGTVKSRLLHALEKLRKMKMNLSEPKGHQ